MVPKPGRHVGASSRAAAWVTGANGDLSCGNVTVILNDWRQCRAKPSDRQRYWKTPCDVSPDGGGRWRLGEGDLCAHGGGVLVAGGGVGPTACCRSCGERPDYTMSLPVMERTFRDVERVASGWNGGVGPLSSAGYPGNCCKIGRGPPVSVAGRLTAEAGDRISVWWRWD